MKSAMPEANTLTRRRLALGTLLGALWIATAAADTPAQTVSFQPAIWYYGEHQVPAWDNIKAFHIGCGAGTGQALDGSLPSCEARYKKPNNTVEVLSGSEKELRLEPGGHCGYKLQILVCKVTEK